MKLALVRDCHPVITVLLAAVLALATACGAFAPAAPPGAVPDPPADTPPAVTLVLQRRVVDGQSIVEADGKYWERYESGSDLGGLYLRTDSIDVFGEYLELDYDGTFYLEENGELSTGTWKLEGEEVILTFP